MSFPAGRWLPLPCWCRRTQALAAHENIVEVVVASASLAAPAADLSADATTFVAFDFFMHDSQATPLLPGTQPAFNTTVRYIGERGKLSLRCAVAAVLCLVDF